MVKLPEVHFHLFLLFKIKFGKENEKNIEILECTCTNSTTVVPCATQVHDTHKNKILVWYQCYTVLTVYNMNPN